MPHPIPAASMFSIFALPSVEQVWLLLCKYHLLLLLLPQPSLLIACICRKISFSLVDLEHDGFTAFYEQV